MLNKTAGHRDVAVITSTGTSDYFGLPVTPSANVSVAVAISSGGSATYTVQYSLDDPDGTPTTWFNDPNATSQTANVLTSPGKVVTCIRLNVTALTGTLTATVLQAF